MNHGVLEVSVLDQVQAGQGSYSVTGSHAGWHDGLMRNCGWDKSNLFSVGERRSRMTLAMLAREERNIDKVHCHTRTDCVLQCFPKCFHVRVNEENSLCRSEWFTFSDTDCCTIFCR